MWYLQAWHKVNPNFYKCHKQLFLCFPLFRISCAVATQGNLKGMLTFFTFYLLLSILNIVPFCHAEILLEYLNPVIQKIEKYYPPTSSCRLAPGITRIGNFGLGLRYDRTGRDSDYRHQSKTGCVHCYRHHNKQRKSLCDSPATKRAQLVIRNRASRRIFEGRARPLYRALRPFGGE